MRLKRFAVIFLGLVLGQLLFFDGSMYVLHFSLFNYISKQPFLQNAQLIAWLVGLILIIGLILAVLLYGTLYFEEKLFTDRLNALLAGEYSGKKLSETTNFYLSKNNESLINEIQQRMIQLEKSKQRLVLEANQIEHYQGDHIIKMERQRIARELHDSVSQELFAMTMLLSAIETQSETFNPSTQELLKQIIQMVNKAQAEMRALLLHLRPIQLNDMSLAQGIEQLFTELDTKVAIQLETRLDDKPMAHEIENHLFRIVQELLSNSLRHAQATVIECELFNTNDILLRFIDDGIGVQTNSEANEKKGGYGLKNINERVQELNGKMTIISEEQKGTIIEIQIPKIGESNDKCIDN